MGRLFQLFGEEAGISRNWATTHFLTFHGCPWNCHGTGWCVFSRANVLQWEYAWLTAPGKQNLPAVLDPVDSNQSLSCPVTCHSFKGCALFPPVSFPWEQCLEDMSKRGPGDIALNVSVYWHCIHPRHITCISKRLPSVVNRTEQICQSLPRAVSQQASSSEPALKIESQAVTSCGVAGGGGRQSQ